MIMRKNRILPKVSEDERPQAANEVVNYLNGKAVILDDYGDLYVYECPVENAILGETIDSMLLIPIAKLPESEQEEILTLVKELLNEDEG